MLSTQARHRHRRGASARGHALKERQVLQTGSCKCADKRIAGRRGIDHRARKRRYAQQLAIIRRMVRDMSYGIEIVGCPIVREADGLAKSSRNTYLSAEERKAALVLSKAVFLGEKLVREGETDADKLVSAMKACIEAEKLAKIDYVSAVDAVTMESVHRIDRPVLVAMAVYIGKTRLIDNFLTEDCAK